MCGVSPPRFSQVLVSGPDVTPDFEADTNPDAVLQGDYSAKNKKVPGAFFFFQCGWRVEFEGRSLGGGAAG